MVKKKDNKKRNNDRSKKLLILIGILVFIFLVIIFLKQGQVNFFQKATPIIIPTAIPTPSVREYHSDFLKIRFMVPSDFEASESWTDVALKSSTGKIDIVSNGTNSDSVEGAFFESLNYRGRDTLQVINKKRFKINGLDVISCNIKSLVNDEPEGKYYYFYSSPGTVFIITTSTPELFDELDQIAQSFHYEP